MQLCLTYHCVSKVGVEQSQLIIKKSSRTRVVDPDSILMYRLEMDKR